MALEKPKADYRVSSKFKKADACTSYLRRQFVVGIDGAQIFNGAAGTSQIRERMTPEGSMRRIAERLAFLDWNFKRRRCANSTAAHSIGERRTG
jgi:hypothetical protein